MRRLAAILLIATAMANSAGAAESAICADAADARVLTNLAAEEDCGWLVVAGGADAEGERASAVTRPAAPGGREAIAVLLAEAAAQTGVDWRLLHAVAQVESGLNPAARSPRGAEGIMQLIPATGRRYGVSDPLDPRQNILAGARYLADLLRRFDQDVDIALAAYNAGEGAVERFGRRIPPYRETRDYVPRVKRAYRALVAQS